MRAVTVLLGALLAVLLGGCAAAPPPYTCENGIAATTCPAKIVAGVLPWTLKVVPDVMRVPPSGTVGMIWSIEDPKARFRVGGEAKVKDGVEFTGFAGGGDQGDVNPCFATDDGRTPASGAGRMYLCVFWTGTPPMTATYKVRYHDENGRQRTVDPSVTNTGAGFSALKREKPGPGSDLSAWRPPANPRAASCDNTANCILKVSDLADPGGAAIDPANQTVQPSNQDIVLTWELSDPAALFDYTSTPRDGITWVDPAQRFVGPCWVAKQSDGPLGYPPVDKGPYYRCLVTANGGAFSANYQITYHGAGGAQRTASGNVSRP